MRVPMYVSVTRDTSKILPSILEYLESPYNLDIEMMMMMMEMIIQSESLH